MAEDDTEASIREQLEKFTATFIVKARRERFLLTVNSAKQLRKHPFIDHGLEY
jgi:hypothetical protein